MSIRLPVYLDFNVSAPEYGDDQARVPAFFAHCAGFANGNPLGSEYSNCDLEMGDEAAGAAVLARVLPVPVYSQVHIAVSYLFNAEGYVKFPTLLMVLRRIGWVSMYI
ncbi:uncharacterized protein F4812DRAFT_412024 [Daldinia caldariorum]|uniref:uncharacterized protein n=1 Tax=Daldinia caldariorum TaxID=326644 RepID=UPI002008D794|nr:uncharacterized protein F4812DRAFT_412024 [Daldinia caldariorum]KAI1473226.1 hypothetical protein F4812DRAFT_412024 [Daldinia caldariorum]